LDTSPRATSRRLDISRGRSQAIGSPTWTNVEGRLALGMLQGAAMRLAQQGPHSDGGVMATIERLVKDCIAHRDPAACRRLYIIGWLAPLLEKEIGDLLEEHVVLATARPGRGPDAEPTLDAAGPRLRELLRLLVTVRGDGAGRSPGLLVKETRLDAIDLLRGALLRTIERLDAEIERIERRAS
jgi:hypothetical protein